MSSRALSRWTDGSMEKRVAKRYAAERRFRLYGLAAVGISLVFLAFLLVTMTLKGAGGLSLEFLTGSDSTEAARAGVWGALKGSLLTILVTMAIAFPIGVLSALYLEEFAPRNRWTDMIEVSINNLAAVPSIIFGLLGLAVFLHVLPLARPGILTGSIIGMARALGETAPLLMIGMRAFIASPPSGITDPSSVLPVQIFLWSDEVDRAFVEKTSAAIIVLLVFMLLMNGLAIYLRNKFERRW